MKHNPISLSRKPIISRTAIYHRVACYSQCVNYESCKLCNSLYDCNNKEYVSLNSKSSSEKYRVIYVSEDYTDWEELEQSIWELSTSKVYLRLIIDTEIPDRVLWASSYSEKNILQINLNMLKFEKNLPWVQKLMSMAGNCGLYTLLFLYPIVPGLVKTYHVIEALDCMKNSGYHHTTLKFCDIKGCIENEGYINFNGEPINTKYLQKVGDSTWKCTPEYLNAFLDKVNIYAIPRKISVSICGNTEDCTGLGGNKNATKS